MGPPCRISANSGWPAGPRRSTTRTPRRCIAISAAAAAQDKAKEVHQNATRSMVQQPRDPQVQQAHGIECFHGATPQPEIDSAVLSQWSLSCEGLKCKLGRHEKPHMAATGGSTMLPSIAKHRYLAVCRRTRRTGADGEPCPGGFPVDGEAQQCRQGDVQDWRACWRGTRSVRISVSDASTVCRAERQILTGVLVRGISWDTVAPLV